MRRLKLICLLVVFCGSAFGQTFDLDKNRVPLTSIDGLWRFHPGDDMRWADPKFDDSSWPLFRTDKPWTEQGSPRLKGFVWYRFRVSIPENAGPAALMLPKLIDDYEVYVDGRKVRSALGRKLPSAMWFPLAEALPLEPTYQGHSGTSVVAIRVWLASNWPDTIFANPGLVGNRDLIAERVRAAQTSALAESEDLTVDIVLSGVIGLLVLGLFCLRTKDREYLWFALTLLTSSGSLMVGVWSANFARTSISNERIFAPVLQSASLASMMLFFQSILGHRRTLIWWICLCAGLSFPIINFFTSWELDHGWGFWLRGAIFCFPAYCWIFIVTIYRAARRDRDAQLLVIPTSAYFVDVAYLTILRSLSYQGWISNENYNKFDRWVVDIGLWRIGGRALLDGIFVASLLAFLIRRFALSRQQEERLAADIEAARQVQQILLPEQNPTISGFQIESVYMPAETVSGDFFQHIPDGEGGVLIVVGDVAGKGLPAAMLVSVLVGAIRTKAKDTSDPQKILDALNEGLQGRRCFATCLAAHITSNGQLRIANAGHIPPYLNGAPLDLPGSLPLGMAADSEYEVHEFQLSPGDSLRFVSDGVLEAQDAAGNLLGFERTRELSRQKAQQIARAAQEFGQKDDITVVGVDFVGVAHATA